MYLPPPPSRLGEAVAGGRGEEAAAGGRGEEAAAGGRGEEAPSAAHRRGWQQRGVVVVAVADKDVPYRLGSRSAKP